MTDPRTQGDRPGLPAMPDSVRLARAPRRVDWKRICLILLGLAFFLVVYLSPPWPDAVDPKGKHFALTHEAKAALGLFLMIATWWVSEVIPIGVTSVAAVVLQSLFLIRSKIVVERVIVPVSGDPFEVTELVDWSAKAFTDFMSPSVWFIFGSIVIGLVFTRTGLTNRLAYRMLTLAGERTSMIYLGCFALTAGLTLIMAHTAVAATIFPLLMAIYALYDDSAKPTRFGKGLFMGMAFTAGAGSIITLLGAARGAVAIGFFREICKRDISFFELTWYMFPVGAVMVGLLWLFFMVAYRPERPTIPGLRERAKTLYRRLGPMSRNEVLALAIVLSAIAVLGAGAVVPAVRLHKSAVILTATVLFFTLRILKLEDLESVPWNIVLLFGGAMSVGYCLFETKAAEWLAIHWLTLFQNAHWSVFLMGVTVFVMIMTNLIMNVAAIAICLPVALVMAPYLNVAPEAILFCALAAAGMPFLFLVGAAPNAIAYGSGQFTSGEFFRAGIPATILLMIVIGGFVLVLWPLMGMPVVHTEEPVRDQTKPGGTPSRDVSMGLSRWPEATNTSRAKCRRWLSNRLARAHDVVPPPPSRRASTSPASRRAGSACLVDSTPMLCARPKPESTTRSESRRTTTGVLKAPASSSQLIWLPGHHPTNSLQAVSTTTV